MARLPNAGDPWTEQFPKGPDIGELIPDFVLPDQQGNPIDYARQVRGQNQALILFHRSAAW